MNRDEVGFIKDILEFYQFQTARQVRLRIDVWIERNNIHSHRLAFPRDLASNPPQANDPERFARKLDTLKLALFPLPRLQRLVRLRNVARQSKKHGDSVF